MGTTFLTALRRELSVFDIVASVLTVGILYLVTESYAVTLGIGVGLLLTHAVDTFRTVPEVDERWIKALLGLFVTAGGSLMLWLRSPLSTVADSVLPVTFVLGGVWVLLDARADLVDGRRPDTADEMDDLDSTEAMLVMQHLRLLADELEDGPKTVSELADACDLTESRVRQAIDVVREDGTIYQVDTDDGPRYVLDEQKIGVSGLGRMATGGLRGLGRRLVRPFRVSF